MDAGKKLFLWTMTVLVMMAGLSDTGYTQSRPKTPSKTQVVKTQKAEPKIWKRPVVLPSFGPYYDQMSADLSDLKKLLKSPLKVRDTANDLSFEIIRFRLGWRRKEPSDDIRTGRRKIITTFQAVEIEGTPYLPAAWQKELAESMQRGEHLMYEDIYCRFPDGREYLMPSLLIRII